MSVRTRNEIRLPDGTLWAYWFGEGTWDWPAHSYPAEWELWRDGVKLARYWRGPSGGWENEVLT